MSRLLVTNKSFELLEPYEGKLSRTVLRGESSRKGADLLDIEMYLNEAHSQGLRSVRCHCNVMAWAENEAELKRIRNDVGAQLALMGCTPRHNTVDVPALFWAAIPGNEGRLPCRGEFLHLSRSGPVSVSTGRPTTARRSRPSESRCPTACRGIPIHLDISDLPMKRGRHHAIGTNLVLGPFGLEARVLSDEPSGSVSTVNRVRISCWSTRATPTKGSAR